VPPRKNTVLSPINPLGNNNPYLSSTPKASQQVNNMIIEESETININPLNKFNFQDNLNTTKFNHENLYEFNPPPYNPEIVEVDYPTIHSLNNYKNNVGNILYENEINYDFKFDDINNQNYNYEFNKEDFNFK
jgi:hypothetical protein